MLLRRAPSVTSPYDREQVPCGVEDASDSAWEEFDSCWAQLEAEVTVARKRAVPARAAALRAADRDLAHALDRRPPPPPAPVRQVDPWPNSAATECSGAEAVMRLARRNDRVCPKPAAWRRLYLLLPNLQDGARLQRPPYPIDSASMRATSHLDKQQRLRSQLEWAERTGVLGEVGAFLQALPEHEWHHLGTDSWPELQA
jgi:hypothetical protein